MTTITMPRSTGSEATAALALATAVVVAAVAAAAVVVVTATMVSSIARVGGRASERGATDSPYGGRGSLDAQSSAATVSAHVETLRTGDIILLHKRRYRCAYDRFLSCTVGSHIVLVLRPKRGGPAYAIDIAPASNRAHEAGLTVFEYLRPASTRGVGCGARIMRLRAYLTHYLRRHRAEARTYRLRGPSVRADALLDALHALHGRCAYPRKAAIVADFVRDALRERWRVTTERFTTTPPDTGSSPSTAPTPPTTMHCAQLLMWLLVAAGVLPRHYEWRAAVPLDVKIKRSLRLSYSEASGRPEECH
jgi:hypothetical protein